MIAKVAAAPTSHSVTASGLLDPVLALWTLLELLALDKLHERLIRFLGVFGNLILLTRLALVVLSSAIQAVVLLADWASEV